jgi:hypothetical protein
MPNSNSALVTTFLMSDYMSVVPRLELKHMQTKYLYCHDIRLVIVVLVRVADDG